MLGIPLRRLRGPAGDDCGEEGDQNEKDCAIDADDVQTGDGPRADHSAWRNDVGNDTRRQWARSTAGLESP